MSSSPSLESIREPLPEFEGNTEQESWNPFLVRGVRSFVTDNAGLLLVMAAQAFFPIVNVAVKLLDGIDTPIPVLEVVTVRMVIIYVCSLAYMLVTRMEDPILGPKGIRLLLVFRGMSGFCGLFGLYFSLQYLSLSDATVLTFLSPLCTAIAGALFLHESFRRTHALAGVVSLIGVTLIARPPFLFGDGHGDGLGGASKNTPHTIVTEANAETSKGSAAERMFAVGVALFGVLGMTSAFTTIRAIGKRAHPLHSMSYFSLFCVVASVIGMITTRTPFIIPSRLDWLALLVMIGVVSFVALVLLTMGLQREAAGRASMAVYTQIVFATIYQRIFFHTSPSWLSIIGTSLILSSAVYVAMTKEKVKSEHTGHGSVNLAPDDHDHVEAGLHGTHAKSAASPRQEIA